jgi:hypothetical protein
VKDNVDGVITGRMHSEQLPVKFMGEPCQRMPVGSVGSCERPMDAFPCKALLYVGVFDDIVGIVPLDKTVLETWDVKQER